MKKVLVLLENVSFSQETVVRSLLAGYDVHFMHSLDEVMTNCADAEIIALSTKHEEFVPALFECGFDGIIIPLLVERRWQGMTIKKELIPAVPVRELPNVIIHLIADKDPIAA